MLDYLIIPRQEYDNQVLIIVPKKMWYLVRVVATLNGDWEYWNFVLFNAHQRTIGIDIGVIF